MEFAEVDDPVERGKQEGCDSAAVDGPGWRPDTFYEGTAGESQGDSKDDAKSALAEEGARFLSGRCVGSEEFAAEEADCHRDDGRHKVECLVTATIEHEGFVTGEEVEEPTVEPCCNIRIHVPVAEEAGEEDLIELVHCDAVARRDFLLIHWAEVLEVEICERGRVEDESEPADQCDSGDCCALDFDSAVCEEFECGVSQPNLAEHIGKDEIGMGF